VRIQPAVLIESNPCENQGTARGVRQLHGSTHFARRARMRPIPWHRGDSAHTADRFASGVLWARFLLSQDERQSKERVMLALRKSVLHLYVDRASQQWIALDPDGNFWIVPCEVDNPWDQRRPFYPTEETELEPVPGHYKYMLGLPT
jgi:hypothetical protein